MRQYQRLMRRQGDTSHTEGERAQLLQLLMEAPGVEQVEIIGQHRKGGYRVQFDLAAESIDDFFSFLEAHDWMSVM